MKKQAGIQRLKSMPKRTRNIILVLIGGLFLICCILPFALAGNSPETTKEANTAAFPIPPKTEVELTSTLVSTSTSAPTETPEPASTETLAPAITETQVQSKLNNCLPENSKLETARVVSITDGDTIHVEMAGNSFTVRYIGIDTPETKDPDSPVQFYGPEAATRNAELVNGKDVILVKDTSETDRYDRLLRYVFVDGDFVNEILVKEGFAIASDYPPDTACSTELSAAQGQAQAESIGLWQPTPIVAVRVTAIPLIVSDGCPNGCTEIKQGCEIKGNINSEGVKIYHIPGSSSYEKTKINPSAGERWFCTADEAVANGWRAPKN